jgi:predicted RNase H-like HicB family nuclease
MEYSIYIEKTSDGWYFGKCIQIPEAFSQGKTIPELKANVLDAIHLVLTEYAEKYHIEQSYLSKLSISISNETQQIVNASVKERMLS